MSKDRMIGFKVSADKLKEIAAEAEKKGQTIAGMVRQIVYEKLEEKKAA